MRLFALAAAAALAFMAMPAMALNVLGSGMNNPRPADQSILIDWDNPATWAPYMSGNYGVASGSVPGVRAAPGLTWTENYLYVPGEGPGSFSATFSAAGTPWEDWEFTSLSFIWGSMDLSNRIRFNTEGGGEPVVTILPQWLGTPNGDQTSLSSNRLIQVLWQKPVKLLGFQIWTDQKAFEMTDVYAKGAPPAVPEPATWAMLIFGFGAVGLAARRDRRQRSLAIVNA